MQESVPYGVPVWQDNKIADMRNYISMVLILAIGAGCAPGGSGRGGEEPELVVPKGFQAEILYRPTEADSSSWVSLAVDPQGRLLAFD